MTRSVIAGAALLASLILAGLSYPAGPLEAADLAPEPGQAHRGVATRVGEPEYRYGVVVEQLSQVGGIAVLPAVAGSAEQVSDPSGAGRVGLAVVGAAMVVAVVGLSAGAWHVGRRP